MMSALRLKRSLVLLAVLLPLGLLNVTAVQAQGTDIVVPDGGANKPATDRFGRPTLVTSDEAIMAFQNGDMETAYNDFYRLAPQGDPEAEFYLAYMTDKGLGTNKNPYAAVSWYKKAADQDYLPAITYMGYMYSVGHGTPQDDAEALKWYTKAAQMGSADAQNALGTMLRDGRGYKKDYQLANQWFMQAATQGNARAQSNLAAMYYLGHGVKANLGQALYWYNLAAKQKDIYALSALAALYRIGEGVNKDPATAVLYYSYAARAGYVPAEMALANMYETGEAGKDKGPPDAAILYARAAKAGNVEAEERLGYYEENGIGLPLDINDAIVWYTKAADEGHYIPAMMALARIYENGKGKLLPPDIGKAINLYKKCADAGEPEAQIKMGEFYNEGRGVTKDLTEAYVWMALAANALPKGEEKDKVVVTRIEISNALSEEQLTDARQRVSDWRPIPVANQYR